MALEVRFSLKASEERLALLEDLVSNFGKQKAKEINDKMYRVIGQISIMPEMYRSSNRRKNLRKCVLSKQTSIYYRVEGEYLEVISFRPNRKNPRSFKV